MTHFGGKLPAVGDRGLRFLAAARVPSSVRSQSFSLWHISRQDRIPPQAREWAGWPSITVLRRLTMASMHIGGEVVMEDSRHELRRHLPIWLAARGRVLVTGLGLGCVVRGLLASPHVSHIDIVEIDDGIIRVIGSEFSSEPRCTIYHDDATEWKPATDARWDFAWHDLWSESGSAHLQLQHVKLLARFQDQIPLERQGAWQFPRIAGRKLGTLGAPR